MRIGTAAEQAGVNIQTLRYYERRGPLPRPPRKRSGYREFPDDAVRMVRFIKRAQDLGFTKSTSCSSFVAPSDGIALASGPWRPSAAGRLSGKSSS